MVYIFENFRDSETFSQTGKSDTKDGFHRKNRFNA
jgi:hypothetical protein